MKKRLLFDQNLTLIYSIVITAPVKDNAHTGVKLIRMATHHSHWVPAETVSMKIEIKRSRFIANIGHAASKEDAQAFIESIKQQYPDARHHCWAYIASPHIAVSDDGEPSGTAGKPILNVLQYYKGVREIVAVVSRYFGGIKLGTGGLVRAYSSIVQNCFECLPLSEQIQTLQATLNLSYSDEDGLRRFLRNLGVQILQVEYLDKVSMVLEVPVDKKNTLQERINNMTKGQSDLNWY